MAGTRAGTQSVRDILSKLGTTKDGRDFLLTAQGKTRTCDLVPSPLSVLSATRHGHQVIHSLGTDQQNTNMICINNAELQGRIYFSGL